MDLEFPLATRAGLNQSPLPVTALNGERVRVRGGIRLQRKRPPLTLTLSPFDEGAMGRGNSLEHTV